MVVGTHCGWLSCAHLSLRCSNSRQLGLLRLLAEAGRSFKLGSLHLVSQMPPCAGTIELQANGQQQRQRGCVVDEERGRILPRGKPWMWLVLLLVTEPGKHCPRGRPSTAASC